MLHFFLEVLQNFMSLNCYDFFIIYTFLPYMALFDRFYKKTNYGSFFLWKSNGPIFSKMYFKLWSSSELPFMGYKRFSPKSPHGANGEGKERVKRLFTIFRAGGRLVGIHIDYLLLVCSIQLGHPFLVLGVS